MTNFILRRLIGSGFSAYLVGGCVRDTLLKRPVTDWDIATSANPEEVERLFDKTVKTGERFGTITVIHDGVPVEVTTYRRDGIYRDNRHPESVAFGASLDEDLQRRDLTINAMAMTESGEIIDPIGGLRDLEFGVIRAVGDPETRFAEDALRMFRAFRFKAQLGFTIERGTRQAILKHTHTAGAISPERIAAELTKTLMSDNPGVVWEVVDAGLLAGYVPKWRTKSDAPFPQTHVASEEPINGRPIATPTDVLSTLPQSHNLRWGVFCVLLGDATIAQKLRLPAKTQKIGFAAVQIAQAGFPQTRAGIKCLLAIHPPDAVKSAAAVGGTSQSVDEILQSGECYKIEHLAISGRDLLDAGIPEGPELGKALQKLLEHVIDHPEENEKAKLLRMLNG